MSTAHTLTTVLVRWNLLLAALMHEVLAAQPQGAREATPMVLPQLKARVAKSSTSCWEESAAFLEHL